MMARKLELMGAAIISKPDKTNVRTLDRFLLKQGF